MAAPADPFSHARPNWSLKTTEEGASDSAKPPLASTAPVLQCYEEAVQEPLVEVTNLDSLYSQVQLEGSDRFDARIMREDFCSTAILATTWLSLDKRNTSQGVDIDLDALADTQARLGSNRVRLLQSPNFAKSSGCEETGTRELRYQSAESQSKTPSTSQADSTLDAGQGTVSTSREPVSYTWAPGAATDRFDRKRARKLEKEAKKAGKKSLPSVKPCEVSSRDGSADKTVTQSESGGPRMTLLHSDVLDLPVPAPGAVPDGGPVSPALEQPDIIASLNYAMAYFHDRKTLLAYLRMALRTLRPKTGVFITDMFGGPPTGEVYPDQHDTWKRFENEIGFGRDGGDGKKQLLLAVDRSNAASDESKGVLEVMPAPKAEQQGKRAEWPRGKLKLVRTGTAHGGFEYWREDGPLDYMTNRFRMSLSFRYSDNSWLRDVFSYDFRVWSIKELTEAMEEAGFVRVKVFCLPRNIIDDDGSDDSDEESDQASEPDAPADEDAGLENMAALIRRTEKEEKRRAFYRSLGQGEKLFANRSFGTYIVACAP